MTTGAKIFSGVAEDSVARQAVQGQRVDTTQQGLAGMVAKSLVASMLASPRIEAIMPETTEPVSVSIESQPEGADLEVDGTYYGSVGGKLELQPGVHQLEVSLPGYRPWKKRVMVREGMKIVARLQEDEVQRSEQKIDIKVD